MQFRKATKFESKLKLAFIGPAGSGKTYSALAVGCEFARIVGGRVGLIDTERGSASLYADIFDYDVLELATFSPLAYVEAIHVAEKAGYAVIVVDSLSHAWTGKGGALEMKDVAAKREQGNTFAAWRHVTPHHNTMVDALVSSTSHLIATMRVKTEYVMEQDERSGRTKPRKVGLAPVQRDGLEYEFSVVGDLDIDNGLTITKTRCPVLTGQYIERPGPQLAETLVSWLRGAPESLRPLPQEAAPETISAGQTSHRELVLDMIRGATSEVDLKAMSAQFKDLAEPLLSEARRAYRDRLGALQRESAEIDAAAAEAVAAAEKAAAGEVLSPREAAAVMSLRDSGAEPETVREERTAPQRGNASARAALGRALGKSGTP